METMREHSIQQWQWECVTVKEEENKNNVNKEKQVDNWKVENE